MIRKFVNDLSNVVATFQRQASKLLANDLRPIMHWKPS
jgi:hypothetical protein